MSVKSRLVLALTLSVSSIVTGLSVAGECPDGPADYIQWIRGDCTNCDEVAHSLSCLACYPNDWSNFAGPGSAGVFKGCRTSPLRPALIESARLVLARPVDNDTIRYVRREMLRVLASWGVERIDSFAVYDSLVNGIRQDVPIEEDMMALAALRDRRTADFIASIYDSLRVSGERDSLSAPRAALNCLYHIPGPRSVAVAKEILSRERDQSLRERAQHIVNRP